VGGKIGEVTGEIEDENVKVGNNKEAVLLAFKDSRLKSAIKMAYGTYSQMHDLFFVPLEKSLNDIKFNLDQFENNIKKIF